MSLLTITQTRYSGKWFTYYQLGCLYDLLLTMESISSIGWYGYYYLYYIMVIDHFNDIYNQSADLNDDGTNNILDILLLVDIIIATKIRLLFNILLC